MAVAEVGDILGQPQGGAENQGGGESFTIVKKGRYDDLLAEAEALAVGDSADYAAQAPADGGQESDGGEEPGGGDDGGPRVVSWDLKRVNAGLGVLTVRLGAADDSGGQDDPGGVVSEKWSVKNVQMQLPLSRFFADTAPTGALPDCREIALWRQEPRKELYDAWQFLAPDGNVYTLSAESQAVAAKYKKGIESVMRFYPVVTRTVTYRAGMGWAKIAKLKIGASLAYIDTPGNTFGLTPGAWLCIQDEAERSADGSLVRTTGWMGCASLDTDLYGPSRWEPMN